MSIALAGFITGLSLIVAIGAQNAFVLRLGLMKSYIGIAVSICALSDAILIFVGTAGMGAMVEANTSLLKAISWVGAIYLFYFAFTSAKRVLTDQSMSAATETVITKKQAILSVLGFTWLNPHVYLDTVLLVGSIGGQYGDKRWIFAFGAALASLIWFISLGYGSKALARVMAKPVTWKVLDVFIAIVMATIATSLVQTALGN